MENQKWVSEIRPRKKLLNFNFKEVWEYRDLLVLFVKREFISKYKQTILGPLWAVIQPILTTVVFTIIFGNLAKLTTADTLAQAQMEIPSFLFYMSGTILWTFFSTTVTQTSNTFIANMNVMGKVYFPRLVTPLSSAVSNLISLAIQFALFLIIMVVCLINGSLKITLGWHILLLLPSVLQLILMATGTGIIISALTTKYRDLAMLVSFGLELWKYGTPVAYGLLLIPEKLVSLYLLNPVSVIITSFRYAVFGVGYFSPLMYVVSWIITIAVFLLGVVLFNFTEKTFMDTV